MSPEKNHIAIKKNHVAREKNHVAREKNHVAREKNHVVRRKNHVMSDLHDFSCNYMINKSCSSCRKSCNVRHT